MPKIEKITAREILDSRGNPTVSTTIFLSDNKYYFASVPSGASTGSSEAYELKDKDNSRYHGLGVLEAVKNVNTKINKLLKGEDISDPKSIDQKMLELDGTDNKMNLGANAIIAVSLAINKAAAGSSNLPLYKFINEYYDFVSDPKLPVPLVNIFNGGKHASTNLDFQELWIIPERFSTFRERLRVSSEIFHEFGKVLSENGYDTDLGNEGGYAPDLKETNDAWEMIIEAIKRAGYDGQISLGLDAGASTFYNKHSQKYKIKLDRKDLSATQMINYYMDWIKKYPIKYLEDPLDENDWDSWQELKKTVDLSQKDIIVIGDDLFTTNVQRLQKGIDNNTANGIIIKPNQIGTISETINCIKLAQDNKFSIIISHRSGETCDDFIADLAVGSGAEHIKTGSISRGERICKYNRLLAIEEELL
jgi:enolase 1/2/3